MFVKKLYAALLLVLGCGLLHAQPNKGMQFFPGSWEELLAEARKTNKPIFVDVYTEWCGPCKLMAKNIFPLESVGSSYNASFVNYKLDAEKGEGVALAAKYQVDSYPTYLYLRSDGELVYRSGGYSPDPGDFIRKGQLASQAAADPYTISRMERDYAAGKRDKEFLKAYVAKLKTLEMDNAAPLDEYLALCTEAELGQEETLRFLMSNLSEADSKTFDYLLRQAPVLRQGGKFGFELTYLLPSILQRGIAKSMRQKQYERANGLIRKGEALPQLEPHMKESFEVFKLEYFAHTRKTDSLRAAVHLFVQKDEGRSVAEILQEDQRNLEQFLKPYRDGSRDSTGEESFAQRRAYIATENTDRAAFRLYTAARWTHEELSDRASLTAALRWSEKALALKKGGPDEPHFLRLSAQVEYKLGNRKAAQKYMQEALALIKQRGDEAAVANYQAELDQMTEGR